MGDRMKDKERGKETKKEQKIRAERTERPLITWNLAFYEILTRASNFYGYFWTYRVVRKIPHTKFATCSLKNAPEDGLLRSETCRATKCYE